MGLLDVPKRIFVGRPIRSEDMGHTLLPKKLALPVFSSDALSSVSYATEEVLIVLGAGGLSYLASTPAIAAGVVLLFMVITASYRQTVREYPSGGGDYVVAHENVSHNAGLVAASALMIDYVLTVAVSISAGVYAIYSAVPSLIHHRVAIALGFIVFITIMNLRGVKESGTFFAIPTYGFVVGIFALLVVGFVKAATGGGLVAESSTLPLHAEHAGQWFGIFLILRAFSSGCTALTGVEAIANGVPAFKKPQSENAAKTLLMMASLAITMFVGITALAMLAHVHVSEEAHRSVVAQIAGAVFGAKSLGFYYVQTFTAAILVLAANTAYQDFPRLASILAQDRYLPRQLHNRGDRLVFSNGIVALALFASLLVVVYDAEVTHLIQLYIVGVFVSFTLGQFGMVRRWNRKLRDDPTADRGRIMRSRAINMVGSVTTGIVLVIVLISKFRKGAWIVVVGMPILFTIMKGISRHYERVAAELRLASTRPVLPARNHAVVLVSQLHNPTLRALNYAKAIKPHTLTALAVEVDPDETRRLTEAWDAAGVDVPLRVVASPFREVTKPVLDYVRRLRQDGGERDVVTVVIPEYVVGKWWEQLLHNQSALRIKAFLLFQPGVMVTSVPWHLSSSPEPEATVDATVGAPAGPAKSVE
ncbi:MAG TPA: APC family permease [Mycobacteriales bacterium]|jgi:amino acid transporter|nr:APC family permease [Mycobacteriales bacterium]